MITGLDQGKEKFDGVQACDKKLMVWKKVMMEGKFESLQVRVIARRHRRGMTRAQSLTCDMDF
jgi:hypothetical protein